MSSSDSSQQNDALRSALRASVAAPPAPAEHIALDALQSRILAQWVARQPAHVALGNSTTGASNATKFLSSMFRPTRHQWQLQLGFAALALMVLLAVQATQFGREPNIDDLLEPDVLALMAMGEL